MAKTKRTPKKSCLLNDIPGVQRGSIVSFRRSVGGSALGIVVSNNLQNEHSAFLLVVPLEKRKARLKAPFAVDLGRAEGLRALHCARCDWVTRTASSNIRKIERAGVSAALVRELDQALEVALSL
jgi:mRNA-degrading endonuclease toxin of MazEF toxin-antitoxin module